MSMLQKFSELHVQLFSLALRRGDERVLARTVGTYRPWWAFGLINNTYFILATDRRAYVLESAQGWIFGSILKGIYVLPWVSVTEARVRGLFLKKKLSLAGATESVDIDGTSVGTLGHFKKTIALPAGLFGLLAPVSKNVDHARSIVAAWEQGRSGSVGVYQYAQAQVAPALGNSASHPPYPQQQAYPQQTHPQQAYPQQAAVPAYAGPPAYGQQPSYPPPGSHAQQQHPSYPPQPPMYAMPGGQPPYAQVRN